jgi:hypothetical protein
MEQVFYDNHISTANLQILNISPTAFLNVFHFINVPLGTFMDLQKTPGAPNPSVQTFPGLSALGFFRWSYAVALRLFTLH